VYFCKNNNIAFQDTDHGDTTALECDVIGIAILKIYLLKDICENGRLRLGGHINMIKNLLKNKFLAKNKSRC
jgi:hypothetical protein